MEDEKIADLYLARDQAALTCTAAKYGSRLRILADSSLEDYQSARECENDTYLEAWQSIPPHEPRIYFSPFWPGLPATWRWTAAAAATGLSAVPGWRV